MKLERKHALILLAIAVWNVVTYLRFIKALTDDPGRPTGYYVAHSILVVVNLLIAVLLGTWGVRAYKAAKADSAAAEDGAAAEDTAGQVSRSQSPSV